MCWFRKKKKAKEAEAKRLAMEAEVKRQTEIEAKKQADAEEAKKLEVKEEPVAKEKEAKVVTKKPKESQVAPKEAADNENPHNSKAPKYHVSQNKDSKSEHFRKWRVRKAGSDKTIKFFDTQKEAISFAEGLAEAAGSSVVIHKMDGSIRKQDYTKK